MKVIVSAFATFSGVLLQATGPSAIVQTPDASTPVAGSFGLQFMVHAAFIWVALIIICLIVFAYRKMRGNEKETFPQMYQKELDAMRKGDRGH